MTVKNRPMYWNVFWMGIAVLSSLLLASVSAIAFGTGEKETVYTCMTKSLSDQSGDGTKENPYNRFEDAVENVKEGGIIYIMDDASGFINVQTDSDAPFVIDKEVTIEPEPGASRAVLTSRAAGILLGADVTIKNIELGCASKYHAQIFANGHKLTLIDVSRSSGCRLLDLVAGGLYYLNGVQAGPDSGNCGQIIVQGTQSEFGNFYGGSINGSFDGDSVICIQEAKGAALGEIYASGAKEAEFDRDNWFDLTEPPAPAADADLYPVSGKMEISISKAPVRKIDGAGAAGGTFVSFGTEYSTSNLSLYHIVSLSVFQGILQPAALTSPEGAKMDVAISENGTLDLTGLGSMEIGDFAGGGRLVLDKEGVLKISGDTTGKTVFETSGGYNGHSGYAAAEHVYIEAAPESSGIFTYTPNVGQEGYRFIKQPDGSWKIVESDDIVIMYYPLYPERGDVSCWWESLDPQNGVPEGAVAHANEGYHFINWTDEDGNEVGRDETFIPQRVGGVYQEADYVAHFEPNSYTVRFEANGGEGSQMPEQNFVYGESQRLRMCTYTKKGYVFGGWNDSEDGTGNSYQSQQEVENLTIDQGGQIILYAQWTEEEAEPTKEPGITQGPVPPVHPSGEPAVSSIPAETDWPTREPEASPKPIETIVPTEKPTVSLEPANSPKPSVHSPEPSAFAPKPSENRPDVQETQKPVENRPDVQETQKPVENRPDVQETQEPSEGHRPANGGSQKKKSAKIKVKLKAGIGKVTVKYNQVTGAKGYEIYCSFKKKKGFKKIAAAKKQSCKITGLKRKKKYYFQVKAFKKIRGKKVYLACSASKPVKVK